MFKQAKEDLELIGGDKSTRIMCLWIGGFRMAGWVVVVVVSQISGVSFFVTIIR